MAKTVKIKLTASMAGAQVLSAGSVIEVSAQEAKNLISAGFAELAVEVETATSKRPRQTTARAPKQKRKRK